MTKRFRSGSHPSAMISFIVTEPIWRTLGHSLLRWLQGGRWLSISFSPALCSQHLPFLPGGKLGDLRRDST